MKYNNEVMDEYFTEHPWKRYPSYRYKEERLEHVFVTEIYDQDGLQEYYIYTAIDVVYQIKHGSYSSQAESPEDYYDQYKVVAWEVSSVVDEQHNEIDPESLLTEAEYKRYITSIEDFVESL